MTHIALPWILNKCRSEKWEMQTAEREKWLDDLGDNFNYMGTLTYSGVPLWNLGQKPRPYSLQRIFSSLHPEADTNTE